MTKPKTVHAKHVQVIEDALSGALPGSACYQDKGGRWLVTIGGINFYINGLAHVVADALLEAAE